MIAKALTVAHPQGPRPLLDAALRLPDGWEQGLDVVLGDCLGGASFVPCPLPDTPEVVEWSTVGSALYHPTAAQIRLKCSSLSRADQTPLGEAVWARHIDYLAAVELASGTENPNLITAPVIAAPATLAEAFACLEAFAASTLRGGPAFIHLPPEQAYDLTGPGSLLGSLVRADITGALFTASGARVIVDPGYTGLAAAFVTGPVHVGFHDGAEVSQTLDTTDNTVYLTVWGPLLVVIDPCAAAQVTLTAVTCTPPV